jgi:hypothetical protein
MNVMECNGIGVPSVKGIFCFQSQLFNCAVQPGGSATFTCRGIAGLTQAVTEVWNSTINTAAQVAADVADAIAKQEQQQAVAAVTANKAQLAATGGMPMVLSDAVTPQGGASSGGSSSGEVWRVGANAALGSLSHVVREKFAPEGGPILQPIFEKMAHMVTNASKSLLNITAEGVNGVAEGAKSKYQTFDLGPPPIRDAADVPRATCVLLVSVVYGVVSGFGCAERVRSESGNPGSTNVLEVEGGSQWKQRKEQPQPQQKR